ncbi:MAG: hypothetical protein JG718_06465 [Candidatus Thiothrix moscowensis]|nr:hypothetical protein [Candidatus Thiothrix moscowensis]
MKEPRYPEVLQSLAHSFVELFTQKGIAEPGELADETVNAVIATVGGLQVYIPSAHHTKTQKRDAEIFSKAGKLSATDLAREYGLSVVRIHTIIKRETEKNRRPIR